MSFTNKGNEAPLGNSKISQATLSYKKGMIKRPIQLREKFLLNEGKASFY